VLRFEKPRSTTSTCWRAAAQHSTRSYEQIKAHLGMKPFSPKDLCHETGVSHATAHRQIDRLRQCGVLNKCARGQYVMTLWTSDTKQGEGE
jgi:predicted HTH transcriptional regulator